MIHGGGVWETGNPAEWLDFSANLRPEGPPEWVVDALRDSLADVRYYPDPDMARARKGIAAFTGLPEEWVLPAAGGTAAIDLVLSARTGCVYTVPPAFGEYARRAEIHGRRCVLWQGECGPGDTLILSNPDNPTGKAAGREELLAFYGKLNAAGAELIVDEAFVDYCPEYSLRRYIRPGLVVVGSLTKILGIPGVRLGFICTVPEEIRAFRERMLPWALSAQAAEIAARLPDYGDQVRGDALLNEKRREILAAGLEKLGRRFFPPGAISCWRIFAAA